MSDVRASRDGAARRLHGMNVATAASFVVGGSFFCLGAFLAQVGTASLVTVNVTYLVGGVFFSLGGWGSVLLAGPAGRGRAWRSAVVLFVGTLFFAVSLVAAFAQDVTPRQSDGWIWLPDITGCVCFLVSGHLALLDVGGGRYRVRPAVVGWWVAVLNQVGSVLFFLAGLAAFTRPATDEAIDVALVNWGTFAGAAYFVVAGVLQSRDPSTSTETVGQTRHDTDQ
jgi:hypothetical protein